MHSKRFSEKTTIEDLVEEVVKKMDDYGGIPAEAPDHPDSQQLSKITNYGGNIVDDVKQALQDIGDASSIEEQQKIFVQLQFLLKGSIPSATGLDNFEAFQKLRDKLNMQIGGDDATHDALPDDLPDDIPDLDFSDSSWSYTGDASLASDLVSAGVAVNPSLVPVEVNNHAAPSVNQTLSLN